ncbi:MAG: peptidyl-prolyl cis-trans isomerase [Candidatus Sumerlaeota bacterium]|nr:peptidyl-prolyl cis-trans isomerase [Candidatus Sumerlaeota bacterium]
MNCRLGFVVRLLAAVAAGVLLLPGQAPAVPDYPFLEELWRPDANVPVATFDGEIIDQEEIFLWQVIQGKGALVARLATQEGTDARALRPLADAVRDLVQARLLAEEAHAAGIVEPWYEEKGSRVLAAPAGIMVLADLVVRPDVVVEEEDILHFYQENRDRYLQPAEGEVVRLRIPLADIGEPAERDVAVKRASDLRAQAIVNPDGLAGILRSHPELALEKPAGAALPVVRGDGKLRRDVEDQLFRLRISQISQPTVLPDGVYLYELRARTEPTLRPYAQVREEIAARLARRFFRQQLDYRVADAMEEVRPVNRVSSYALLEDEMELLQVGSFLMTKGEFRTLFPDVDKLRKGRPTKELIAKTRFVVESETVTQILTEEGFVAHPRYETARELGAVLAAARKARELPREIAEPTPEELRAYAEAHRDELAPAWSSIVWRLVATPRAPEELGSSERAALAAEMQNTLSGYIAESTRLMVDRVKLNGPTAYVSPQFVVERVIDPDHTEFTVAFERVGELTAARAQEAYSLDLAALPVGAFSPALPRGDGTVVAYYRADRAEQAPPADEVLMERAATAWKRDVAENPARQKLAQIEASGRLTFNFPN